MNDDALNKFFPSMARTQGNDTAISPLAAVERERSLEPISGAKPRIQEMTEDEIAANLYGDSPDAGAPLQTADAYDVATGSLLDAFEREARYSGDVEEQKVLAATRQGMNAAFHEYGVGQSEAATLTSLWGEYAREPRSDEAVEVLTRNTEAALRAKWGSRYGEKLATAKAVVAALDRKIPMFRHKLEATGAGSDQRIIEALARAGERRRR